MKDINNTLHIFKSDHGMVFGAYIKKALSFEGNVNEDDEAFLFSITKKESLKVS